MFRILQGFGTLCSEFFEGVGHSAPNSSRAFAIHELVWGYGF